MDDPLLRLASEVEGGALPALSIKQPYPHHIFHDDKDVENRNWPTRFRGWFLIHAGVSKSEMAGISPSLMQTMPRGGIVGAARITDCVTQMNSRWFFGKFGFVLRDAFPIPLVPCRGTLGFFPLDPETRRQVAQHIRGCAHG